MTLTLNAIKAEQTKIAEMIAIFERQAKETTEFHLPESFIALKHGEHYAGLIIGKDGEPSCHLVLLASAAEEKTWNDAKAWASEQGGELPTRREQALLFANLKEQFQPNWYWSSEQDAADDSCAWVQDFDDGGQDDGHKSYECRAHAVRRLLIIE